MATSDAEQTISPQDQQAYLIYRLHPYKEPRENLQGVINGKDYNVKDHYHTLFYKNIKNLDESLSSIIQQTTVSDNLEPNEENIELLAEKKNELTVGIQAAIGSFVANIEQQRKLFFYLYQRSNFLIGGYKKDIANLNAANAALKAENETLTAENAALKAENQRLIAENAALKAANQRLIAENAALKAERDTLNAQLTSLKDEYEAYKIKVFEEDKHLKANLDELTAKITVLLTTNQVSLAQHIYTPIALMNDDDEDEEENHIGGSKLNRKSKHTKRTKKNHNHYIL